MSDKKNIGPLGEELTALFLMKRGFTIVARNYRKPWGELDIVAEKKEKIHFIEVKSFTQNIPSETGSGEGVRGDALGGVSSETVREQSLRYVRSGIKKDRFRPEDNVNTGKMARLRRIIQTYLSARNVSSETSWQFDVAAVFIDGQSKRAKINLTEDVIL